MSLVMTDKSYIVSIWMGNSPIEKLPADWMGILYNDEKGWHFSYRFRYHMDDKVFNSDDVKYWYHGLLQPEPVDAPEITRDELAVLLRTQIDDIVKTMNENHLLIRTKRIDVNGGVEEFKKAIEEHPEFHTKEGKLNG